MEMRRLLLGLNIALLAVLATLVLPVDIDAADVTGRLTAPTGDPECTLVTSDGETEPPFDRCCRRAVEQARCEARGDGVVCWTAADRNYTMDAAAVRACAREGFDPR